jgi:hypothetical protein
MAMPSVEVASKLSKTLIIPSSPREKEHCGPSSDTEVCANLLSRWERTEVREFRLNVYLRCLSDGYRLPTTLCAFSTSSGRKIIRPLGEFNVAAM